MPGKYTSTYILSSIKSKCDYSCGNCEFKTSSKIGFRLHLKHSHKFINNTHTQWICGSCYKNFKNEKELNEHVKSHNQKAKKTRW